MGEEKSNGVGNSVKGRETREKKESIILGLKRAQLDLKNRA